MQLPIQCIAVLVRKRMIQMYEFILYNKLITTMVVIVLAIALSFLAGRGGAWWRVILYNFTPIMALAFFLLAPLSGASIHGLDVASGLIFELVVLALIVRLFITLLRTVQSVPWSDARKMLQYLVVAQILLVAPIIASSGFGIFSQGGRLDYLYEGPLAKYLTYGGLLISLVQAPLLANQVSHRGGPGATGWMVIAVNFGLTIVAGSKGASFLWLLSAVALIDFERANIKKATIFFAVCSGVAALGATAHIVSSFLGISLQDFAELVASRFFLANDARALAFDMRNLHTGDASLLSESFRSLGAVLGAPAHYPPLGLQLYEELLGSATGNGANSSLMALIIYFSRAGQAMLPAICATWLAILCYVGLTSVVRTLKQTVGKSMVLTLSIFLIHQLSQDFLAFQIVVPLVALMILGIFTYDRRHKCSFRRSIDFMLGSGRQESALERRSSRV